MSQENAIVRTAVEAYRSGDTEAMLACCREDLEWRPALSPGGIERAAYIGHDGLRKWFAERADSWGTFELHDPEYRDVGERVVVLFRIHARGSSSGVEIDTPGAKVYETDGEKIRRITGFATHAEALEAVGLSE